MTKANYLPLPSKKKRLSSLTLVILGVSIAPLVLMAFGVLYLDRYRENLIDSGFLHLRNEAGLTRSLIQTSGMNIDSLVDLPTSGQQIFVLDKEGNILQKIGTLQENSNENKEGSEEERIKWFTEIFAEFFVYVSPLVSRLPQLPLIESRLSPQIYEEIHDAMGGEAALSAWAWGDSFVMTAAMPLESDSEAAVLFIVRDGTYVSEAIDEVRKDILQAFIIMILLTFCLAIYLSSFIAVPLKKLSRAAEDIRRGKRDLTDLPDMSLRRDEIGDLSTILRQMTEEIDQRIDAVEKFAADVTHEIKNPITSLRSAIETAIHLKERKKRDELLEIMVEDVHRLDRLITDISRYSRLDAELARDMFHVVDLAALLKEVVKLWGESSKNISLKITKEPHLILGKTESLMRVFQNLIGNAISFSDDNDIVRVSLDKEEDWIVVSVEDSGPGIPEENLEKIFERFYSDRSERYKCDKNSGLGLSISRQIIKSHGGQILAENTSNGARFKVFLKAYDV